MLPKAAPSDRAAAWGVCGGIPRYLALWDESVSFEDNLGNLVANEQGLLVSEGELVLAGEEIAGHRGKRLPEQVLRAIASERPHSRRSKRTLASFRHAHCRTWSRPA